MPDNWLSWLGLAPPGSSRLADADGGGDDGAVQATTLGPRVGNWDLRTGSWELSFWNRLDAANNFEKVVIDKRPE